MARLTIYFTSDTHGYLYNTTFADGQERSMGLLSMDFPKDGNTLVIDGGDTIQGSPLTYYLHEKGEGQDMIWEALNRRGYDYVTLGNHDFNYGRSWLSPYLHGLHAECLCANVEDLQGELPLGGTAIRVMENGLKVGLFGIVTDWVNRWEKKDNLKGFKISSPLRAARACAARLREEGADIVVGIYHGGMEKDLETGRLLSDTDENLACRICEEVPVDLLLTGHQHIAMTGSWNGTHLVQTPFNALQYVKVQLQDDGTWVSELVTPPSVQTLTEKEKKIRGDLEKWLDTPIGHLSRDLWPGDKLDMALHGTSIAAFFNRVQLDVSGADVSLSMIPNSCRGFAKDVTVRDVVATYIYPNTLCVLKADGKTIRAALEQTASYFDARGPENIRISDAFLHPKEEHYNYDYFAGLTYAFDLSRPVGQRVCCLKREGRDIQDEDVFTVAMNDYRATGTGKYPMWTRCEHVQDILTEMSELILTYFSEHALVQAEEPSSPVCFYGDIRL